VGFSGEPDLSSFYAPQDGLSRRKDRRKDLLEEGTGFSFPKKSKKPEKNLKKILTGIVFRRRVPSTF
jgi:hypothetical protein